jgi:hypothetical protein
MPVYLAVGPAVALIGVVAVFFVMRHKSVQTRSMYSSRRSQFERKVKAARSRTLAPRGRGEPAPAVKAGPEPMATSAPQAQVYFPPAPHAAPPAPTFEPPSAPPRQAWEMGPAPVPVATPPVAPPTPPPSEPPPAPPFEVPTGAPAQPEWTPSPAPAEPAWTGPAPAEPVAAASEPVAPVESAGGEGWSIVGATKDSAITGEPVKRKGKSKRKEAPAESAWQLASGEAPNELDEEEVRTPSRALAIAQYAVLVVGLVMVLVGVLVMVANSHVT